MKRKGITPSLRWQVFARDGFRCRYCGAQAGEPGVVLHADHIVSVIEGGTDAMDNLAAACQKCNGGKGARSLDSAPGSEEAVAYAESHAVTMRNQAEAIAAAIESDKQARKAIVKLAQTAYGYDSMWLSDKNTGRLLDVCRRYGPEVLCDWMRQAASRGVKPSMVAVYVFGIIRTVNRERGAASL